MAYTEITRSNVNKLAKEIEDVLKKYGAENGLVFSRVGGGKFTATDFTFKANFKIEGEKSFDEVKADRQFDFALISFGLTNEVRRAMGMDVKLVGYNSRKWKRPFIVQDINSKKQYVLSEDQAIDIFKKAA